MMKKKVVRVWRKFFQFRHNKKNPRAKETTRRTRAR